MFGWHLVDAGQGCYFGSRRRLWNRHRRLAPKANFEIPSPLLLSTCLYVELPSWILPTSCSNLHCINCVFELLAVTFASIYKGAIRFGLREWVLATFRLLDEQSPLRLRVWLFVDTPPVNSSQYTELHSSVALVIGWCYPTPPPLLS